MARRRAAARTIIRTVQAPRGPAPVIRIAAPAAIKHKARHYARAAGRGVAGEKHTLTALIAAAALGLAEKSGMAIPTIGPLGPAATIGVAAWAYGKWGKNQTAAHLATGLLAVAVNRYVATGTIAGDPRAVVFDDED